MYDRVVVGTDLSSTAKVATDRAATLASRLEAELIIVHAGTGSDELEALASDYGAKAVTAAGPPAEVLIAQAEAHDAGLIVVGSVGMSGAKRFLLGSVPNKVSHHAPTDVLIVKTDPPRNSSGYDKVLVGTDGSPTAMRAVDMASSLGSRLGAKTTIVCVYEPPTEQELEQYRADPEDPVAQWNVGKDVRDVPSEFKWRIAGTAQAEDILDRAAEHAAEQGLDAEVRAIEGSPAEELIGLADSENFDMIAVGSVGMSGAKRFMLGNVPHRISHHAATDVLILRTT
ncbi:MAG TPA: universal stress protein [Actinomycetota bacterium]|nr:universal stress protein [Actinomycetota bacterium]